MASRWISATTDPELFDLPKVAACYAIYLDGLLTYVGSTENLRSRVGQHYRLARYTSWITTPWGRTTDLVVKYRPSRRFGDWAMVELRLIRRLKPPGNIRGVKQACEAVG